MVARALDKGVFKRHILSSFISMFILECCNSHTCYCVGMVSVTSASRYQSRPWMYIRGLIPRNGPSQFRLQSEELKLIRFMKKNIGAVYSSKKN